MRKSIATLLCLVALAAGSSSQAHDVKSPRDASSGLATGKRMHKPFIIRMSWSSPSDASAYCSSVSGQMSGAGALTCTVDDSSQAAADARALGCTSGACPSSAPPLTASKATPKLMETCQGGASCTAATGNVTHEDSWEKPVVR